MRHDEKNIFDIEQLTRYGLATIRKHAGTRAIEQDILQSGMLQVWARRSQFKNTHHALKWLGRCLDGMCIDAIRRRQAQSRYVAQVRALGSAKDLCRRYSKTMESSAR